MLTDSSVVTNRNVDAASVISWADCCGNFEHQTMAWLGLLLVVFGPKMITRLSGDSSVSALVLVRFFSLCVSQPCLIK